MRQPLKFIPFALGIGFLCAPAHAIVRDAEPNRYESIPTRNIFGLRPIEQAQVTNQPPILPKLILTGITTILGNKRVLMKEIPPAGSPGATNKEESLILTEGQREGAVEVLAIDEKAGSVRVNNSGTEMTLTFEKDGVKLASAPPLAATPPPPSALPTPAPVPGTTNPPLPGTEMNPRMPHFPGRIPRGTVPAQGADSAPPGFGAGAVPPTPGGALPPTGGGPNPPAATPSLDGFTPEEQQIILQLQREAASHETGIPSQITLAPGGSAAETQTRMAPGYKSPTTGAPQPTPPLRPQ